MSKKTARTINDADLVTKVTVENFPSRMELYNLLDVFLEKNNIKKDYTSEDKDNKIVFLFKSPVKLFFNF
jgi:hypothetical protein